MESKDGKDKKGKGSFLRERRLTLRMIALTIACSAICIAARVPQRLVFLFDRQSQNGSLAGLSEKERLKLMQKASDESQFTFRINGNMNFETGSSEGVMFIENPQENSCILKVRITMDSDERVLYETGYIKPGTGIGKDCLKETLPKGEYKATALITSYDSSQKEIGRAQAGIRITVRK